MADLDANEQLQLFDANGDGKITYMEFCKACAAFGKMMSAKKMKDLFNKLDKDGSGTIEVAEFMTSDLVQWKAAAAAQAVDAAKSRSHLAHQNKGHARTFGSEADRQIGASALMEKMKKRENVTSAIAMTMARSKLSGNRFASGAQIFKAFQFFDADGSGTLDEKEMAVAFKSLGIPVNQKVLKELMDSFDNDGNRSINYEEFVKTFAPSSANAQSIYRPLG